MGLADASDCSGPEAAKKHPSPIRRGNPRPHRTRDAGQHRPRDVAGRLLGALRFGNVTLVQRMPARCIRWLDQLAGWPLRLRVLPHPVLSCAVILTLASIGLTTAYSASSAWCALPYADGDRIVLVYETAGQQKGTIRGHFRLDG
jgi:hypothetical protein